MKTKVIVNGAYGKMGQVACETVEALAKFSLVAKCGRKDNLAQRIQEHKADIVIDFTTPDVAYQNAELIMASGARLLMGTTGLSLDQIKALAKFSEEHKMPGIIAPNVSLSAMLMMQFAKQAAKYFPQASIIEMHHLNKKDAPSGTAIRTAELIQAAQTLPPLQHDSKEILPGVLGAKVGDVAIHSLRLMDVVARQQVIFNGLGESLTIDQQTSNREAYRAGIALALEKLLHLERFVYGLDELL